MTSFFCLKQGWFGQIVVFWFFSWNQKRPLNYFWNSISVHCLEVLCRSQSRNPLSRHWGKRGQKDLPLDRKKPWRQEEGTHLLEVRKVRNRSAQKKVWFICQEKKNPNLTCEVSRIFNNELLYFEYYCYLLFWIIWILHEYKPSRTCSLYDIISYCTYLYFIYWFLNISAKPSWK